MQPLSLANGASAWLVTELEAARAVLSDLRFSSDRVRHPDATQAGAEQTAAPPAGESRADGMFVFMDPPEHTRLRRVLTGQFTVRRMRMLEAHIREIADECIDAMLAAGTAADLVPAYALPLPSLVICEMLGVDYADRAEFRATPPPRSTPTSRATSVPAPPGSCTASSRGWSPSRRPSRATTCSPG